ncbi:MAG: FAD-binding oxidoreductase [Rhodobacterales bacterium]|nr:FAD-binding oxidoreductase [Rhodobacterales bacterium]
MTSFDESIGFVDFIDDFLKSENINADFKRTGRFRGALRPAHFDAMAAELEIFQKSCGVKGSVVARADQSAETGSRLFHGGVVYDMDGGLHPAKFHNGLIAKARALGVTIIANCPVTKVEKTGSNYTISTPYGTTLARKTAICTNAYTGAQFPELRRRVLPLRSAMIATDVIAPEVMTRLMPKSRVCGDSRRIVAYYRPSPDGKRILFGGRATGLKDNPAKNARQLHTAMTQVFPELKTTSITHVWSGLVAYTFDHAPHVGQIGGLHYAMGYCGSGVARATYFGQKMAYKMLGNTDQGRTAFDDLPFATKPLYKGDPWFMPAVLNWHRLADRLGL